MKESSNIIDSPKATRRREREKMTVSQMIAIFCAGNHGAEGRTQAGHCGEPVCEECAALDAYAIERTQRCRQMETKVSCEECGTRCYRPQERQRIREAMRYAGPRMITKHPIAAIRHLLGK